MVDILHRVGVKSPSPEKVYDALTTVEGLAGWWTDDSWDTARASWASSTRYRFSRPVGVAVTRPARSRTPRCLATA